MIGDQKARNRTGIVAQPMPRFKDPPSRSRTSEVADPDEAASGRSGSSLRRGGAGVAESVVRHAEVARVPHHASIAEEDGLGRLMHDPTLLGDPTGQFPLCHHVDPGGRHVGGRDETLVLEGGFQTGPAARGVLEQKELRLGDGGGVVRLGEELRSLHGRRNLRTVRHRGTGPNGSAEGRELRGPCRRSTPQSIDPEPASQVTPFLQPPRTPPGRALLGYAFRVRVYYHDQFDLPLPEGHRFPMAKYTRLRERVSASLVERGVRLEVGPASSDRELALAHDPAYVARVVQGSLSRDEVRRIGFPWSPALVERSRRSVGSTIAAVRSALEDGVAVNLAGGTHHAFADRGQGYCVFNDVAVGARLAQAEEGIRRIVVLDCDVHQGNGTAAIFRDDPNVFTFSIHGATNFPFEKEPGDLDVGLPDGTGDDAYLIALEEALATVFAAGPYDLAFYVSGADPYVHDRFGRLALSREGLARRDALVFSTCHRAHLPVAVSMAGGYAPDLEDIVAIHYETVCAAARFHRAWNAPAPSFSRTGCSP